MGATEGQARDVPSLVGAMTIDEKAALTVGVGNWHTAAVPRLGVPPVRLTDGPNGARGLTKDHMSLTPSLSVPTGSALGATWDPAVVSRAAAAVAKQAREKSARILLAPTVNLHRHPLWGRNFECFSEDPLLSGALASAYIQGAQGEGVIATVKHLVCNEAEHERRICSSDVDERALRELYLLPFEMAVRLGHVHAVMTGYNRLNGVYLADNAYILTDVLRGEWGFDGIVMTDWNALADTEKAGNAGLDLEMPGPGRAFGAPLAQAVRDGRVKESELDAKAARLLGTLAAVGAFEDPEEGGEAPTDRPEDRDFLRHAAADAMVLLSNDGVLPLRSEGLTRVALVGPGVERLAIMGGGSARVVPHYELSLPAALRERLGPEVEVVVEKGCTLSAGSGGFFGDTRTRPEQTDVDDSEAIKVAAAVAAAADVAIVVVGTNEFWESESYDRLDMALPGRQAELVQAVLAANPKTVVAINSGAAVDASFASDAAAMLQIWFGGQELANALADVLTGASEPGGRLPISLPQRLEHTPAFGNFPAEASSVLYGEGLFMGYRWYEARHLPVLFPFGHGLSYTSFRLGPARMSSARLEPGGRLSLAVEVQNVGDRPGSQVVQVYVAPPGGGTRPPNGRLRPVKQLKGFAKVHLAPGEATTVEVGLEERAFAYWDVADRAWPEVMARYNWDDPDKSMPALHRAKAGWYVDGGTYQVLVGTSSADTPISIAVEVEGNDDPLSPSSPVG